MGCCGNDNKPTKEEERHATDIIWLIIFFLFLVLMIFVASFALVYGDPLRIINGYDSFGNVCGSKNLALLQDKEKLELEFMGLDMSELRYVFFFNVNNLDSSLKVCVKKCPDQKLYSFQDMHDFYNRTDSKLCRYDYNKYKEEVIHLTKLSDGILNASVQYDLCPTFPVYKSKPILNRCIPLEGEGPEGAIYDLYGYLNSIDMIEQVLADLYAAWHLILAFVILAVVLSTIVMLCLHYFALVMSYIVMVVVTLAACGVTALLWWGFVSVKNELEETSADQILDETVRNEKALLTFALIATLFSVLLIVLVIYIRPYITVVSQLFGHAGQCLTRHPTLLLQPVLTFAILLTFFVLWVCVMVSLATAKHLRMESLPSSLQRITGLEDVSLNSSMAVNVTLRSSPLQVLEYVDATWVRSMWWIWLVGLIWISEFILACQQMIVASAVSVWYFARNPAQNGQKNPILWSWRTLIFYHLGTVAKGSFLITLFKLPRLILQWVSKRCNASERCCIQCCLKGCCCCMWLFENFLKFMNHNAYTVTATRGTPFCTSARIAWKVVFSNMLQVATINSVGDLMLFLCKVAVTTVICCLAQLVLKADETLHLYAIPLVVIAVFSYFVAHCVFSVYEMAVDTLFLCFYDDYYVYDATDGRELTAGKELYEFMITHENIDRKQPRRKRGIDTPETIRFNEGSV